MAVPSRLMCPISSFSRCSLMSASCTRSARHPSANSSKAREKVTSEGSFLHRGKPQIRRRVRSVIRRSISPAVVVRPSTALATKAFANQARSKGGRPTPHHVAFVNSSMRTHSSVDHFLQLRRQRTRLVLQLGQQFVLNHVPSLHDQFASGSIHLAGVMMLASKTASCQKWPPAPSVFASRSEKSGMQWGFCKRLIRAV